MRVKGRITSWNDDRGFGFITPLQGGKPIFVHIRAFANRDRRPSIGQVVSYAASSDKRGRPCAADATLAGDRLPRSRPQVNGRWRPLVIAIAFLLIVAVAVLIARLPAIILALYLVASLISFVSYAIDKSAARRGSRRTPESTLHLLALAGGWPGALVARQQLRHKSKKQPFSTIFWITVAMNCAGFVWLLTPDGMAVLQTLLAA